MILCGNVQRYKLGWKQREYATVWRYYLMNVDNARNAFMLVAGSTWNVRDYGAALPVLIPALQIPVEFVKFESSKSTLFDLPSNIHFSSLCQLFVFSDSLGR